MACAAFGQEEVRWADPEMREQMPQAQRGRVVSEETRARMRAAQRQRFSTQEGQAELHRAMEAAAAAARRRHAQCAAGEPQEG